MWRRMQAPLRNTTFWLIAADFPFLYYAGVEAQDASLALAALLILIVVSFLAAAAY